jgi:hypothetical protein
MAEVQIEPTGHQQKWQETFEKLGRAAPAPRAGEGDMDYLRRMSRLGSRYVPSGEEICSVNFDSSLPDSVVPVFSERMRAAVERNMRRTDNMDPADPTYRTVLVTDPHSNMKIREFFRPRPFTDDFGTRCRRVSRINAPASMPLYAADRAAGAGFWR